MFFHETYLPPIISIESGKANEMVATGRKFDFDAMTVDELWQLHEMLSEVLSMRLNSKKRELEKRLAQLQFENQRRSASADEIAAPQHERRKYPRVLPKYQNPDKPFEKWSGRGKQPRWLTAALESGRTIEEFAIRSSDSDQSASQQRRA